MVGNDCVIVLKKFRVLTAVIEDASVHDEFNEIFTILADIMALVMACRFLSTDEINHLENLCTNFGEKFPLFFPARNITRKIHELIFNIPRFVKKVEDNWHALRARRGV